MSLLHSRRSDALSPLPRAWILFLLPTSFSQSAISRFGELMPTFAHITFRGLTVDASALADWGL
jgi:hypothetical protein